MKNRIRSFLLFATVISAVPAGFGQGSLTPPPGPPAPSMKTLEQIEPRTLITSLPYTISRPGHYYVATNLTAPNSSASGLTVSADCVTIDLNGFCLSGTGSSAAGQFPVGLFISTAVKDLTVRNGTFRNWGYFGISAANATHARYEHVKCLGNVSGGFWLGDSSAVKDCRAANNGGMGLRLGIRSTAQDCQVADCTLGGIQAAEDVLLVRCQVNRCATSPTWTPGITVGNGSTVKDCLVASCSYAGLYADAGALISGCTARTNGGAGIIVQKSSTAERCVATGNGASGIQVGELCRVVDNHCSYNGGGIHAVAPGNDNRIDSNVLTHNLVHNLRIDGVHNLIVRNQLQGCPTGGSSAYVSDNKLGAWVRMDATVLTSATGWENFFDLCP